MGNGLQILKEAWENREGPAVLTTVSAQQKPNSVYVGDFKLDEEIGFIISDNYFSKTRENLKNGCIGSFLFITKEGKSFQVKGPVEYHTDGIIYEDLQVWHSPDHPGVAAAVVKIDEIYSGAEQLK